jgi:phage baseplate assembly protein W
VVCSCEHWQYPFQFVEGSANVVEQDSQEDIISCVEVIASTPIGAREEIPDFGMEQAVFSLQPIDTAPVVAAIVQWEPRAVTRVESGIDSLDNLVAHVLAMVSEA